MGLDGDESRETGNLIITLALRDDLSVFTCAQKIVSEVKGIQLRSVSELLQQVNAKGKPTKVKLPCDLEEQLRSVACVKYVEKERTVGQGEGEVTGRFIVGFDDENNPEACADQIYKKIPGAQIAGQLGNAFYILGKKP